MLTACLLAFCHQSIQILLFNEIIYRFLIINLTVNIQYQRVISNAIDCENALNHLISNSER